MDRSSDDQPHGDRVRAETFGAVADLYDGARPSYPAALIDSLTAGRPTRVLDIGCGTGIASELLAARGCSVLGVEADERMAAVARAKGLDVEVARFEDWDPGERTFDLVTAAQAWHWIDPRAGAEKVSEVLTASGRIAVFWNFGDPVTAVRELLAEIYRALDHGPAEAGVGPDERRRRTQDAVEALAACGRYGPVGVSRFAWSRSYDTPAWLAFMASQSDHQVLPVAVRERLLTAVGAALDGIGGSFEVLYETVLVSARRR